MEKLIIMSVLNIDPLKTLSIFSRDSQAAANATPHSGIDPEKSRADLVADGRGNSSITARSTRYSSTSTRVSPHSSLAVSPANHNRHTRPTTNRRTIPDATLACVGRMIDPPLTMDEGPSACGTTPRRPRQASRAVACCFAVRGVSYS